MAFCHASVSTASGWRFSSTYGQPAVRCRKISRSSVRTRHRQHRRIGVCAMKRRKPLPPTCSRRAAPSCTPLPPGAPCPQRRHPPSLRPHPYGENAATHGGAESSAFHPAVVMRASATGGCASSAYVPRALMRYLLRCGGATAPPRHRTAFLDTILQRKRTNHVTGTIGERSYRRSTAYAQKALPRKRYGGLSRPTRFVSQREDEHHRRSVELWRSPGMSDEKARNRTVIGTTGSGYSIEAVGHNPRKSMAETVGRP